MPLEPDREQRNALAEANARLLRRVADLERRVAFLERLAGDAAVPEPTPLEPPPLPPSEARPHPEPPPSGETAPPPVEEIAPPVPVAVGQPQAVETRIGLTWLNRVAVVTCILAVAFFFKYAVDNEWIGPSGRVMLGVMTGLGCLAAADALWRRAHQIYAQGLCGLGIAILYLSFQASFALYRLVPQSAAFALMALVTVSAAAMALRYGSQAIAALALVGGYVTPVLLSTGERRLWFLFTYVLVLNLGAFALSRARQWRALEPLAFISTLILYGGGLSPLVKRPAEVFLLVYWALFVFGARYWAVAYLAHFFAGIAAIEVWSQSPEGYIPAMLGMTAGLLAAADRRNWPAAPSVALATFWASYILWMSTLGGGRLSDAGEALFLTAAFLLLLAWTPWRALARGVEANRRDLALIAANAALFSGRLYLLLETEYEGWRGLAAVAVAATHLALGKILWERQPAERRDPKPVLLLLAVALTLLTLAIPIQFSAYRITMAWALEGAALAWIAARTESRWAAASSVTVLAIALGRALGIDGQMYASHADYMGWINARFLTFVVTAAALWAASRWLYRTAARLPIVPLLVYCAGHLVMLWGLGLEVLGWAGRTAAPENLRNIQSAAISVLTAGYAVALAAGGIATRTRLNRLLGLGLIGFVVVKLYFYDVWELRLIYRVMAFAGLGALLLVMSFLYSRYRASIESWLQDENSPST